ncbi:MAG: RNA polymerase sigma factor [Prevotellaceae bacterium]|jgi:RNA polymerase sigma-70 factor (ECF subfamily)|nr:RNA polymerase sigma factor [Prevotellaceae bacterium]
MDKCTLFETELVRLQGELYWFAYKLTANKEDANDLLQDTTLHALNNKEKYMPGSNFKGWMFTIMRHIFINNYRKILREQTYMDTEDTNEAGKNINAPSEISPDMSCRVHDIRCVMNAIPQEYASPINMYVVGFKYQEIADRMRMPIGTVKSRIFVARQLLRDKVKQ